MVVLAECVQTSSAVLAMHEAAHRYLWAARDSNLLGTMHHLVSTLHQALAADTLQAQCGDELGKPR